MAVSLFKLVNSGATYEILNDGGDIVIEVNGSPINLVSATALAAVPSPTGGSTEDAEARAAIDLIIARMVALGFIEAEA